MCLSHMLSRSHLTVTEKCEFSYINDILDLRISKYILANLLHAAHTDGVVNNLKKMMLNGWPENKADVPDELKVCFS